MLRAAAVVISISVIIALTAFAGAQEVPGAGDLTNAGSEDAAEYRNGTSFTRLAGETLDLGLEPVAEGLVAPLMLTTAGDGTGRLFVVDQIGTVSILDRNGTPLEEPFLDVRDRMADLNPSFDERGLLSMAFHPGFRENGRVFVFYSAPLREGAPGGWDCTNRLSGFRVDPANPDRVNVTSEEILLEVDKPQSTHNGGSIGFSPRDGYLYVSLGDGGGAGDSGTGHTPETGNAQDLTTIYGKVLRIDVDDPSGDATEPPENATWATAAGSLYGIPEENPFVGDAGIPPEIYAYGLRNPAFLSFDAEGNLYVADAGQDLFEEVSLVVGGGNYGWRLREGTHCFDLLSFRTPPETCEAVGRLGEPLVGPVIEGGRDLGTVIIGGRVYNGTALPGLAGRYVFGYWNGNFAAAAPPPGWNASVFPDSVENLAPEDIAMWRVQRLNVTIAPAGFEDDFLLGFGVDEDLELYALTTGVGGPDASTATGRVWKFVPANVTAPPRV